MIEVRQRPRVRQMFKDVGCAECFVDDVCLGSNDNQHLILLDEFLDVCRKYMLRVKYEKCMFRKSSVLYLGFVIDKGVWKPDPIKVAMLKRMKVTDLKSLRAFLGAINFYRRHVSRKIVV